MKSRVIIFYICSLISGSKTDTSTESPSFYRTDSPSEIATESPSLYRTDSPSEITTDSPSVYQTSFRLEKTTESPLLYQTDSPFEITDASIIITNPIVDYQTTDSPITQETDVGFDSATEGVTFFELSPTEEAQTDATIEPIEPITEQIIDNSLTIWPNTTSAIWDFSHDESNRLLPGDIFNLDDGLFYAGDLNFQQAKVSFFGFIEITNDDDFANSIEIRSYYSSEVDHYYQAALIYGQVLNDYYDFEQFGDFSKTFGSQNANEIYGGYLFTWVYQDGQDISSRVISQLALLFDSSQSVVLEVRNLNFYDDQVLHSNEDAVAELENFSGRTVVYMENKLCYSEINYSIFENNNSEHVHDRTNYLPCDTLAQNSCSLTDFEAANNTNVELQPVFVTNGDTFAVMKGLLEYSNSSCGSDEKLFDSDYKQDVYVEGAEFIYELLSCLYDSDHYVSSWSAPRFVCVDENYLHSTDSPIEATESPIEMTDSPIESTRSSETAPFTTDDFFYDSFTTFAPTESPYFIDHTAGPTEDIIYHGSGYAFTSSPIGSRPDLELTTTFAVDTPTAMTEEPASLTTILVESPATITTEESVTPTTILDESPKFTTTEDPDAAITVSVESLVTVTIEEPDPSFTTVSVLSPEEMTRPDVDSPDTTSPIEIDSPEPTTTVAADTPTAATEEPATPTTIPVESPVITTTEEPAAPKTTVPVVSPEEATRPNIDSPDTASPTEIDSPAPTNTPTTTSTPVDGTTERETLTTYDYTQTPLNPTLSPTQNTEFPTSPPDTIAVTTITESATTINDSTILYTESPTETLTTQSPIEITDSPKIQTTESPISPTVPIAYHTESPNQPTQSPLEVTTSTEPVDTPTAQPGVTTTTLKATTEPVDTPTIEPAETTTTLQTQPATTTTTFKVDPPVVTDEASGSGFGSGEFTTPGIIKSPATESVYTPTTETGEAITTLQTESATTTTTFKVDSPVVTDQASGSGSGKSPTDSGQTESSTTIENTTRANSYPVFTEISTDSPTELTTDSPLKITEEIFDETTEPSFDMTEASQSNTLSPTEFSPTEDVINNLLVVRG